MKYFILLLFVFSCSKSVEDNCFQSNHKLISDFQTDADQTDNTFEESIKFDADKIIAEKPDYVQIVSLKKFRSFKIDSAEYQNEISGKDAEEIWKKHQIEFALFSKKFNDQFEFSHCQKVGETEYAFGENSLGFWLLEIKDNTPKAYFLGLSFSHYCINKVQNRPIINKEYMELEGSFVKITIVGGLPGYKDYSAIEDGKLFKIKLKDLFKDSDSDGYNDIFETTFGLNPTNKDSDADGIDDFKDLNPMYKSGKNKFTALYESLMPNYGHENMTDKKYFFEVFASDCDYFHEVNPKYRVLFIPLDDRKRSDYLKISDVIHHGVGRIKKNKKNPDMFYIQNWSNSSTTIYTAQYKNGKWYLEISGGIVI
ncbi:hypothetical protein [Chryseobacterium foetidum]|uniref:hypothetical protein n=1 Tax=Chryseobacterium foetidum TaxID=2951057 RepID=UPI0021CA80B3|nr:hypothetical protein [Chryseobacterium foetidum]